MIAEKSKDHLSLGVKLSYSVGAFGENLAYNFYYLFFIYFLTDYAGISPAVAGTISLCSVACGITDPLVGHFSDKSRNPKGKRRPFILKFSIPLGLMIILLFTNIGFDDPAKVMYFMLINFLFWVVFSLVDIPYLVLGAEITKIPQERITLRAMCSSFNYLSYAFAGYTLYFVSHFDKAFGNQDFGWVATAIMFAIFVSGGFLLSYYSTKGREPANDLSLAPEKINILESVKLALKIKPYRNLLLYTLFFMTGIMVFTTNQVYLFTYNLGASEAQASNIYVGYAILVVILSPVMGKVGNFMGNQNALILSILITSVGFVMFQFIPMTMVSIWGILLVCGIGASGFFVVSFGMLYDVTDVAELKTGLDNKGILISFSSFVIKAATAFAMWICGLLLSFYQYDPEAKMTQGVLDGIKSIGTIIPGVICAISLIFILMYSLNSKNMSLLRKMKEDKDGGKEIDMKVVNKLL